MSFPSEEERKRLILDGLEKLYPDAKAALNYENPFQLLVAVVLSAQCTDERVNKVTTHLFKKYQKPADLAAANQSELAEEIRECGLFRNKSKNLIGLGKMIVEQYDGKIPTEREELEKLPGVGRKTANVVVSNVFNTPAIAVDTHVYRVSNRLGLVNAKDVLKTEMQLQRVIPREKWSQAHHWLIYHGRQVCKARKPKCKSCDLANLCPSREIIC